MTSVRVLPIKLWRMKRTAILACTLAFFCAGARADSPHVHAAKQVGLGAYSDLRVAGASSQDYLHMAEAGVARARHLWWDKHLDWYDSRLQDQDRYPLATIWDTTPLFEALDAIAIARPTPVHKAAVESFAKGAERYWDASLRPHPGFAPYRGDRGQVQTWFDDNGWWGLAFLDAYQATGVSSYLREAERAFEFIARAGWNQRGGGLWWNTSHPYIAGELLAAGSLLGARIFHADGPVGLPRRSAQSSWIGRTPTLRPNATCTSAPISTPPRPLTSREPLSRPGRCFVGPASRGRANERLGWPMPRLCASQTV